MSTSVNVQGHWGKHTYTAQLSARRECRGRHVIVDLTSEIDILPQTIVTPRKRKLADAFQEPLRKASNHGKGTVNDTNAMNFGEKRPKRFRAKSTIAFRDIEYRAITQRMFVLDRVRGGTSDCPNETMTIAGSTGNLYTVYIGQIPLTLRIVHVIVRIASLNASTSSTKVAKRTLPYRWLASTDVRQALIRVLYVSEHLRYQVAFLQGELRQIFAEAPEIPHAVPAFSEESAGHSTDRKPCGPEEDCPICCMPLEERLDEIVYCKAACGNNLHAICFKQWETTKRQARSEVTCPVCRAPWQEDISDIASACKKIAANCEGYINIAMELGLSGRRDYSTYHPFWVRQQARQGVDISDYGD